MAPTSTHIASRDEDAAVGSSAGGPAPPGGRLAAFSYGSPSAEAEELGRIQPLDHVRCTRSAPSGASNPRAATSLARHRERTLRSSSVIASRDKGVVVYTCSRSSATTCPSSCEIVTSSPAVLSSLHSFAARAMTSGGVACERKNLRTRPKPSPFGNPQTPPVRPASEQRAFPTPQRTKPSRSSRAATPRGRAVRRRSGAERPLEAPPRSPSILRLPRAALRPRA